MAKIYWTREVKNIMDNLIRNELEVLLDPEMTTDQAGDKIFDIREHKKFADDVISVMESLDRQEEEEWAERDRKEAEKSEKNENAGS